MTYKRRTISAIIFTIILFITSSVSVFATTDSASNTNSENKYHLGSVVNTGKDNGYSEANALELNDQHYSWKLGSFFVSGHTSMTTDGNGNPVFLKNVGDDVALWFTLEQNIKLLNGKDTLSISEDKNGYDKYFGIEKTNFGRGTLIVKHTDYQNSASDPVIYTDYLSALTTGADTKVDLFEEGDYEVALDYEIKNDPRKIFDLSIIPEYNDYRIFFKFSVRNGNCMVYPFDTTTGEELTNSSITENGFYLDLAKSRYLNVNIKKEVLKDGADGLTEDTRFNRPAKDGDRYTDEGIYVITVSNPYVTEPTVKKIYVGTNNILKAHVTTDLSIKEIKEQMALGATINDDGTINAPLKPKETEAETVNLIEDAIPSKVNKQTNETDNLAVDEVSESQLIESISQSVSGSATLYIVIGSVAVVVIIVIVLIVIKRKFKTANSADIVDKEKTIKVEEENDR